VSKIVFLAGLNNRQKICSLEALLDEDAKDWENGSVTAARRDCLSRKM